MLVFTNPAAFWALLGLLVPLAIHLWNRRPGQVVPVGALRWLTAGANRRMRRLHLSQWPLLLMRLLLLGMLVLVLAGPRWQQPPRPGRPQVLVAPPLLTSAAWPLLRPRIDSLRSRGAELRLLAPGFPLLPDTAALRRATIRAAAQPLAFDQYWDRAAEAADSFPGQPLYLYTPATSTHFQGSRPALPARLRWQLVAADSATATWLQAATRPTPDSLRLTLLRYSPGAPTATRRTVPLTWPTDDNGSISAPGLPPQRFSADGRILRPAADSTAPAVLLQHPMRVGLAYTPDRRPDARYLRAALQALSPALPAGLRLREWPASAALPTDSLDWLLWLADAPPPAAVYRQLPAGLHLLRDASGKGQPVDRHFAPLPYAAEAAVLRRRVPATAGPALWTDDAGQPVLTRRAQGQGAEYQLLTRLHPTWTNLPDNGQLPELLLHLLSPAATATADARPLPPNQLRTAAPGPDLARPPQAAHHDLRPWLALLAGLLFGAERLLAARRSTSPTPAA